jgi:glycosyltransferase involved in cell wall biosynthesis
MNEDLSGGVSSRGRTPFGGPEETREEDRNRLRVALVTDVVWPWSRGGAEARFAEFLDRADDNDVDVVVYTNRWWEGPPPDRPGVSYRAIGPRPSLYRNGRRRVLPAVTFAINSVKVAFGTFDVLVANQAPVLPIFPLWAIARWKRRPLVLSWHEVWDHDYWVQYFGRAGAVAYSVEKAAAHCGDHFETSGSSGVDDGLVAMGISRDAISQVPGGLRTDGDVAPPPVAGSPEVVYLGRLLTHKRVDVVIRAFAILVDEGRDVRLGIIGIGPEQPSLEALVAELGVGSRVTFYGDIESHDDVLGLVRSATVFLFPSEREGFGLAVAEALSLGTPVVTVDHETNESRHLVADGVSGSIVAAGDPKAMATAAARWLDQPVDRSAVSGRFSADHPGNSWDDAARLWFEMLDRVVRHETAAR